MCRKERSHLHLHSVQQSLSERSCITLLIALVLWLKMPSDYMKLFSAVVVACFLAVPYLKAEIWKQENGGAARMGYMLEIQDVHKTFNAGNHQRKGGIERSKLKSESREIS